MKDTTEQGPVDGPRLDGFGFVGSVAVDALLADMQLPASEIDRCGFHGVGVWLVSLQADAGGGLVRAEADDWFTNERVSGNLKDYQYQPLVVASNRNFPL